MSKRGRRRCVFCPNYVGSKEHIFSKWLEDLLPAGESHPVWHRRHRAVPGLGVGAVGETREQAPGVVNSRRVRAVCESCNSGWMSGVVSRAKPVASPLIEGIPTRLDRQQMTDLATWVTLATMMAEFDGRDERVIPDADLGRLRKRLHPPQNWVVLLGRYDGEKWGAITYHRHRLNPRVVESGIPLLDPDVKRLRFQVTTYNLRHLLGQTFSTEDDGRLADYLRFPLPPGTIRIWPPDLQAAEWPAGPGCDDAQAYALADGYYQTAMQRAGGRVF